MDFSTFSKLIDKKIENRLKTEFLCRFSFGIGRELAKIMEEHGIEQWTNDDRTYFVCKVKMDSTEYNGGQKEISTLKGLGVREDNRECLLIKTEVFRIDYEMPIPIRNSIPVQFEASLKQHLQFINDLEDFIQFLERRINKDVKKRIAKVIKRAFEKTEETALELDLAYFRLSKLMQD